MVAIKAEHELHKRRLGRNVGLGIVLLTFVALVYGLTVAKVSEIYNPAPADPAAQAEASE